MTRVVATVGLVLLFLVQTSAQQTALTEGMLKAAELEVPQLVELLELKPGMTVADVGAGFGAWTMRFSRFIGPNGRVYATDIGAPQLAALRDTVQREKLDERHRHGRVGSCDESAGGLLRRNADSRCLPSHHAARRHREERCGVAEAQAAAWP